jgi:23S rRNA (cytosine1962-C5)-methyltransferase
VFSVTGVDSSRPALEMAEKNAALNGRELEWIEANAFDLLREYSAANRRYDTIVLDPPSLRQDQARPRKSPGRLQGTQPARHENAASRRDSRHLLLLLPRQRPDFLKVVAAAAQDAHKSLRVVEHRGAAKDHPILLNVPETSYLQCLILTVSN